MQGYFFNVLCSVFTELNEKQIKTITAKGMSADFLKSQAWKKRPKLRYAEVGLGFCGMIAWILHSSVVAEIQWSPKCWYHHIFRADIAFDFEEKLSKFFAN